MRREMTWHARQGGRIFDRMTKHRPWFRLTIRQRVRVLEHHWDLWTT